MYPLYTSKEVLILRINFVIVVFKLSCTLKSGHDSISLVGTFKPARWRWLSSSQKLVDVVVVVCPLQPSSSVNPGCPGPESSVPVSSRLACPISSQVTYHY